MDMTKFVAWIVGAFIAIGINLGGRKIANKYSKDVYSLGCFAGMLMYFVISIMVRYSLS